VAPLVDLNFPSVSAPVFTGAANACLILVLGLAADCGPVFFPDICVDFDGARIQTVAAARFATRNPIADVGLDIKIVALEAEALTGLQSLAAVIQRFARLRKRDAPNARWARNAVVLPFDVHDARFHRLCLIYVKSDIPAKYNAISRSRFRTFVLS
jgi:hypothetical protein